LRSFISVSVAAPALDDGDAAGQLGEALLELLAVVVAGGLLDLHADLIDRAGDLLLVAGALDDQGLVLVDGDALGRAELFELDVLELEAEVFGDELPAGDDGDVAHQGLAAVTEARGLDGADVQHAAQLVHDQGAQGFDSTSSAMISSGRPAW
jgi:hypothetical protein